MTRLRVASFNVAFDRPAPGALARELAGRAAPQVARVAEIIRRVRPDILLLCEFDHDGEGRDYGAVDTFRRRFLAASEGGGAPIDYPHALLIPTNTGERLPCDLDGDGRITAPQDCHGFGQFHGQYGMLLLSRFPIEVTALRSFRYLRWCEMPGAALPPSLPEPARSLLRLSSKNHIDVPVCIDGRRLHLLAMHPTPPVFQPHNLARNSDELRLFHDYLDDAAYLVDDAGQTGGLDEGEAFVLLGDFNADPCDGDGDHERIRRLLAHPRLHPASREGVALPRSEGGRAWGGRRPGHQGDPACWTHRQGLRLDYVLPSRELTPLGAGVCWEAARTPLGPLFATTRGGDASSDHRLVWVDIAL